jgi:AcrR family transcriptional regulator
MARMKREDRERLIVEGAIKFFAERGFSGQTRELARGLGITQPLLYRYFPSKQALVDRVHEELFVRRWNPAWEALTADRRLDLGERIRLFYLEFCGPAPPLCGVARPLRLRRRRAQQGHARGTRIRLGVARGGVLLPRSQVCL